MPKMNEFDSKVVLITGASSGIGAQVAKRFAKEGARLSICGRNEERLTKVAQECKNLGAKQVLHVVADLQKKEDIEMIIEKTGTEYDAIDVLTTWETFNNTVEVDMRAPVFVTQLAVPYLEKSKGNIINISSIASDMPWTVAVVYGMCKAGLDHFTKTAALELSKKAIRVNSVSPGHCDTMIARYANLSEEVLTQFYENIRLRNILEQKHLTTDHIADSVLFLASDSASMITGACLKVDGGSFLLGPTPPADLPMQVVSAPQT
ncbi:putative oxidoreductase SERP2049 isoform X2 [Clavelina lepadiformis]|uniref:putative oxidoreductase SERP2049 isoform X2 n=1 Tax=Clavelina lepadiformis TaxID=159417 RepID=UPI004041A1B6